MKVTFFLFLAGAINLALASPTTTEPPMVNYDSTDEPTTVDPPMVNFDDDDDDGDDDDGVVIELPEDEDEDAAAEASMMETEAAMHERQLYKVYDDDDEGNDNSTIEVEPPNPDDDDEQDRIVNGFFARNGWFPSLARIFPTFGRTQFM